MCTAGLNHWGWRTTAKGQRRRERIGPKNLKEEEEGGPTGCDQTLEKEKSSSVNHFLPSAIKRIDSKWGLKNYKLIFCGTFSLFLRRSYDPRGGMTLLVWLSTFLLSNGLLSLMVSAEAHTCVPKMAHPRRELRSNKWALSYGGGGSAGQPAMETRDVMILSPPFHLEKRQTIFRCFSFLFVFHWPTGTEVPLPFRVEK